jgi:GT2 family glycosyltransferase
MPRHIVSILTVTMNRSALARECLGVSLERAGYPYEFLSWDNNSQEDTAVIDYVASLNPAWHHRHHENIGYAPAVNQLLINALKGPNLADYFCVLDPDMLMSPGWLAKLVECYEAIPITGFASIHCVMDLNPQTVLYGKKVHVHRSVWGVKFLSAAVQRRFGYFYEGYGLYGVEDADYNVRLDRAGMINYYVAGPTCQHRGVDSPVYRKFKDSALQKASQVFDQRVTLYDHYRELHISGPVPLALRDW